MVTVTPKQLATLQGVLQRARAAHAPGGTGKVMITESEFNLGKRIYAKVLAQGGVPEAIRVIAKRIGWEAA